MKKKILVSVVAVTIICTAAINYKMTRVNDMLTTTLAIVAKSAFAQSESGYEPGSCSQFYCDYETEEGWIEVRPGVIAWGFEVVPGHYYDCDYIGNANICLCNPFCEEGAPDSGRIWI